MIHVGWWGGQAFLAGISHWLNTISKLNQWQNARTPDFWIVKSRTFTPQTAETPGINQLCPGLYEQIVCLLLRLFTIVIVIRTWSSSSSTSSSTLSVVVVLMLFINKFLNGKTDPPVNPFICIYIFDRTDLSPALLIVYPFLCTLEFQF